MRILIKPILIFATVLLGLFVCSVMIQLGIGAIWYGLFMMAVLAAIRAIVKYKPKNDANKTKESLEMNK